MPDDDYLTVAEVAELLKLNQQTVRNWINSGKLPSVRVGDRRLRIRRSDLDPLLTGSPIVPVEPGAALRLRLAAASQALADVSRSQESNHVLIGALRELSQAANALADALDGID